MLASVCETVFALFVKPSLLYLDIRVTNLLWSFVTCLAMVSINVGHNVALNSGILSKNINC